MSKGLETSYGRTWPLEMSPDLIPMTLKNQIRVYRSTIGRGYDFKER